MAIDRVLCAGWPLLGLIADAIRSCRVVVLGGVDRGCDPLLQGGCFGGVDRGCDPLLRVGVAL